MALAISLSMTFGPPRKHARPPAMTEIKLSRKAAHDLAEIADYTIHEFGIIQACQYKDSLQNCFNSLQENPMLGRSADDVAPDVTLGLRRIRQQAHVIFYIKGSDHILIVRVLHHSMDFERHL